MHTDLMSAPSLWHRVNAKRVKSAVFQKLVCALHDFSPCRHRKIRMRPKPAVFFFHCSPFCPPALFGNASQKVIDLKLLWRHFVFPSIIGVRVGADSTINLLRCVVFKHIVNRLVYVALFGKKNYPACFPVESVHYANIGRISQSGIFRPKVSHNCVMQIVPLLLKCGFGGEKCRFVDQNYSLVFKQNRKLTARRIELANNNLQLKQLNLQLANSNLQQADLNEKLQGLNRKLLDTNKHREALASIYIDLCAKYIDKLEKFQTLVKRKIKANQAQDLLQTVSSTRVSEEDAATFLNRFDKAFLELYPSFVEEFNSLLRTEGQIVQKSPLSLTTELRTFALIRLGVKNTADIAGLLFLSPQTIYNCRSVTKGKAICKDSFDQDVMSLCTVIHNETAEQ